MKKAPPAAFEATLLLKPFEPQQSAQHSNTRRDHLILRRMGGTTTKKAPPAAVEAIY